MSPSNGKDMSQTTAIGAEREHFSSSQMSLQNFSNLQRRMISRALFAGVLIMITAKLITQYGKTSYFN